MDPNTSQATRNKFEKLLKAKKIEVVGGGWVQHDETLTSPKMQILNTESGLEWLSDTFPFVEVETMWQIDPFGASYLSPALMSQFYSNAVLNRIGDKVKDRLKDSREMQFHWTYEDKELLTHVINNHYSTEQGELVN